MPVLAQTALRDAGVVGAGGAGFPTYAKLACSADVVLANGAECEPLLRVDQGLMLNHAEEVARGLQIAAELVGAGEMVAGLKGKYQEAAASLEAAGVQVERVPDFYPVGDEHVLLHEVTRRVAPQGGLPLQAGVVVQNMETLVNVARAAEGRPVTDTYVTVVGEVAQGGELLLPLGLPIREAVALAGGPIVEPYAVIEGGPMMGVLTDPARPVTKTTKALIVLPVDHRLVALKLAAQAPNPRSLRITQSACCQCSICTDLCPRSLLGHAVTPHRAVGNLHLAKGDARLLESAALCTQCNLCGYFACPLRLQPNEVHAHVKRVLRELAVPGPRPEQRVTEPRSYREYRRVPQRRLLQRLGLEKYDRALRWDPTPPAVAEVTLPLSQHIGAAAAPAVRPGDRVLRGDRIGDPPPEGLGVPVHASIDGRVVSVTEREIVIAA